MVIPVILPSVKVAVSLPDPLFARAEAAANRLGSTRSAFYAQALATYLESLDDEDEVTSALDLIYGDSPERPPEGASSGRRLIDAGSWEW